MDMPAFSVDRELYTNHPADVVHWYPGDKVVESTVELVRSVRETQPNTAIRDAVFLFTCDVEHVPEADNYAHSHVFVSRDGSKISDGPGKAAKKALRIKLANIMTLIRF